MSHSLPPVDNKTISDGQGIGSIVMSSVLLVLTNARKCRKTCDHETENERSHTVTLPKNHTSTPYTPYSHTFSPPQRRQADDMRNPICPPHTGVPLRYRPLWFCTLRIKSNQSQNSERNLSADTHTNTDHVARDTKLHYRYIHERRACMCTLHA